MHMCLAHTAGGGARGRGKTLTTVLTEMPALMRERATRLWPLRAARWRGENPLKVGRRDSGEKEMR